MLIGWPLLLFLVTVSTWIPLFLHSGSSRVQQEKVDEIKAIVDQVRADNEENIRMALIGFEGRTENFRNEFIKLVNAIDFDVKENARKTEQQYADLTSALLRMGTGVRHTPPIAAEPRQPVRRLPDDYFDSLPEPPKPTFEDNDYHPEDSLLQNLKVRQRDTGDNSTQTQE